MNQTYELWREKTLFQVWPEFIAEKHQEIGEIPHAYYNQYFRALAPFFSRVILKDIHIGHIVDYRNARLTGKLAGPGLINYEIDALQQILIRAGLWLELGQFYKPLPIPKNKYRQVLFPEEALHRRLWRTRSMRANRKVSIPRRPPAPAALEDPLEILQQANCKA